MDAIASLYRQHVERLSREYADALRAQKLDRLVISPGLIQKQSPFDDQDWPFKPTPFFAHWLPLAEPGGVLAIDVDGSRTLHRALGGASYWESPPTCEVDFFWDCFAESTEAPAPTARTAYIGPTLDGVDLRIAEAMGVPPERFNPKELLASLDAIRAIKSPYEVECIARANRRAVPGHVALQDAFAGGASCELDLHLLYLQRTRQDAWQTPYSNIVALGEHAAVLHHVSYDRESTDSSSLLVDAGATYLGYASDITRTWVRGHGEGADAFRALIAGIELAQQEFCRQLVPGTSYEELHEQAHVRLAEVLADVGLVSGSTEEMVANETTRAFFPHGLGHSLGLQVHDVGCKTRPPRHVNAHLRTTATVAEGHVFTIEPGCYFIPMLLDELRAGDRGAAVNWALVDQLRPFGGIRIEDNIAVLAGGNRNLTRESWPA